MALSHTTHSPKGRANIVQHGGTPQERIVGKSYRTRKVGFGSLTYLYRLTDTKGSCVYEGTSMAEGLKRLETRLA